MKSHVKENIAKNIISNSMDITDNGDGTKSVLFMQFAQELIKSKTKYADRLSDWKILQDKTWSVTVDKQDTITGSSIMDCIRQVNEKYDKE